MRASAKFAAIPVLLSCMVCEFSFATDSGSTATIPLDLSGGRPAVELSIDGLPAVLATFDTGTMYNFIDSERAEEFSLSNEGKPVRPFDQQGAFATTIRNPRIGDLALPSFSAIASPGNILPNRVAFIGPNIFKGSYVTLDFAAAELRISPKTDALPPIGEAFPYGAPPYAMPNLQLRIGDTLINALLDTGSAYTLLFPLSDAEKFSLAKPLTESGSVRGHNGEYKIFDSQISGVVQIGPLSIENPAIRFTDAVPFANVGTEYLKKMVITLDPEARKLWVSTPNS